MTVPSIRQQLRDEVEALPEALAAEVVDFILFLRDRHAEETYLWQKVEATHAHRQRHPDDVHTVNVDELEFLTDVDNELG